VITAVIVLIAMVPLPHRVRCSVEVRARDEESVFVEGPRLKRQAIIERGAPWLITHYEQVLRDHADHARHAPDLLIVDEAQRVKGIRAKTARVLKSIDTPYLFALTGTPLENRLEEAYAIAQLIDQRLLPPLWQLDRDHFVRDPKGRSVVMYSNLGALRSRLAPAFLRRRKEDVHLELPERIRSIVKVPVKGIARDEHDEKTRLVARILQKKVILPADLDRMQKLLVIARRCCDGAHMLGKKVADRHIPKLRELEQALRELCLDEGRKVVVFSEWKDMTKRVEKLCNRMGILCLYLHGGVPVKRRPALIRALEEHDGPAVFLSTDAGGVGLNLQAADAVVNLDLPWNPAKLEQRIARVHRIGSRKPVRILLIVGQDCIEDRILALHDTKRDVMENVWATDGEDEIAAPGGSGAFKAMVQALLRRGPLPPEMADAQSAGGREIPEEIEPEEIAPEEIAPEEIAAEEGTPAIAAPERDGSPPGVDLEALGRAVAEVAPALPPDHRRSLATVFRALAEALET
ncbi:MAG: DEAD/DEAH box helicase, partial [Planctomycetota bacterium]